MAQTINDPQYYMTKEQYDSLMSALRLEFARRSGKNANGVSLNYTNLNGPLVTVWDENKFKPAVTVSNGTSMYQVQGNAIIDLILEIFDIKSNNSMLIQQQVGGNINVLFGYN